MCKWARRIIWKLICINTSVCNKITAKIFVINRNCNACDNSLKAVDHFFNLTKLNSQSAKLDLIVHSSEKLYFAVCIDLCQITCFICSLTVKFNKYVSSLFRKIHISPAYSHTRNNKLSRLSIRQNLVFLIDNVYLNITIRNTDRNVFTVCDNLHRTADRCLCRAITIHNINIRIYGADLIIQRRWKSFCSQVKNFDLSHCFFKLWDIDNIWYIGRCWRHDINFIFYD